MNLSFKPTPLLPKVSGAVIDAIRSLAHHYAWMTYAEIRRAIPSAIVPASAAGKRAILATLLELEANGYIRRKGDLWGFTSEYRSFSETST